MAKNNEILIPDIGSTTDVDVIEVMVKPGDTIKKEDSLITLESEKATMEIPSPKAGVVAAVNLSVGDKVAEGALILTLKSENVAAEPEIPVLEAAVPAEKPVIKEPAAASQVAEVTVPDIGDTGDVDIIEVLVKPGDKINKDDSLITLESEKATMEVPSPYAGEVKEVKVSVGDKVSQGNLILTMQVAGAVIDKPVTQTAVPAMSETKVATAAAVQPEPRPQAATTTFIVHAGPAVRRIAREFGVDLAQVSGSGPKNRILKEDVQTYVKTKLTIGGGAGGIAVAVAPAIDFSKYGEVETVPLNKIKKLTGVNVHRSWVTVPHVTQFDEADITELEAFRKENKSKAEQQGFKLTPLVFIMKAVVGCLKELPNFNSSLDQRGENLIRKHYYHVGVAVDTPNGLVVPVIRDVDKKGLFDLAKELGEVSLRAREKGLMPKDMEGSSFTISSLGGIGGTAFTPIVKTPDVAILGVSRAKMQPVYIDGEFVPRLILPLSLSYDHRVIDGAAGARFTSLLAKHLADIRTLLL